ncbi:hypothetical protein Hanom_Chr14g01330261 [Helianthus anomalus]
MWTPMMMMVIRWWWRWRSTVAVHLQFLFFCSNLKAVYQLQKESVDCWITVLYQVGLR